MTQVQRFRSMRTWLLLFVALALIPSLAFAQAPAQIGSGQAVAQYGWEPSPQFTLGTLYALSFLTPTDGWAGAQDAFTFHYNGVWTGIPNDLPKEPIRGIDMVTSSNVWAVGWKGLIAHWTGASWQLVTSPVEVSSLDDVVMLDASNGWAIGTGGTILRYAGGNWSSFPSPTSAELKAIDMLDATHGWAVGIGGYFLRWNGSAWQVATYLPGVFGLYDVDMLSATDGWAVGGGGRIFHYNGSTWTEVLPSPTTNDLRALEMVSATSGWAVGDKGTIVHYDGHNWVSVASPTAQDLTAIDMLGYAEGWAAGRFGTILHYTALPANLSTSYKQVDKHHASPGDEVRYDVVLTNSGEQPTPAVTVTDLLDYDLVSYVAGSASITKGMVTGPNPLVATITEIWPGESVVMTFRAILLDQPESCWAVPNEAVVASGGGQLTLRTHTLLGTCQKAYMPIVRKHW
jgi:uncharacterized repeat protein (TIGR01451 family)